MAASNGKAVELCLLTEDDSLETAVTDGLENGGLRNRVYRLDKTASAKGAVASSHDAPCLFLIDMRAPNTDARVYLSAMSRQRNPGPPIIVLVADNEEDTEGLDTYARIICGQISPQAPVDDLVGLVHNVLPENWDIEPGPTGD
ncbi:MAG: hypothetical protein JJ899_11995 [Alphaproteobacteria bacterium]|nr:hypothetical protein [Alphaproteobacteria bacterium]